jgi:hypothetical protein
MQFHLSLTVFASALLSATAAASSLQPPVLPLAVRNPYLSLWYNARTEPWKTWPMFWTGEEVSLIVGSCGRWVWADGNYYRLGWVS